MLPVFPGDRVEITGLDNKTELNGTLATIQSKESNQEEQDRCKYVVKADVDDQLYKLRPENLIILKYKEMSDIPL
eukprot:541983-Prymnesium_polylepis.2